MITGGSRETRLPAVTEDPLGFTVVGPNHFLASGHPGADQDGPGNVGLIETTDGGRTFRTRYEAS
ncbi:MAG: hypothetical protein ABR608_04290 [Pseudonocardiaceae bacterium]